MALRAHLERHPPKGVLTGLKLCNNELTTITGLYTALSSVIDPSQLLWLDLSCNHLTHIESELLLFENLLSLNLHGNCISNLKEVAKLKDLKKLTKFSLHGNTFFTDSVGSGTSSGNGNIGPNKAGNITNRGNGEKKEETKRSQSGDGGNSSTTPNGGNQGKTLHTRSVNYIEKLPFYREKVIWMLRDVPLKVVDFTAITVRDRQAAHKWGTCYTKKPKIEKDDVDGGN